VEEGRNIGWEAGGSEPVDEAVAVIAPGESYCGKEKACNCGKESETRSKTVYIRKV
jgi:hypothetical protein